MVWCMAVVRCVTGMQDSTYQLQEISVNSNRIQAGFNSTSAHVMVIEREALTKMPAVSVVEVLGYLPGVDIRQRGVHGVQADAGIRGSTFDQVLILVNGVKVSDPQTGHHSLNLAVALEAVDRIEVLKGPAARVFGQNAFAGAINIITKVPEGPSLAMGVRAGEYGSGGWSLSGSYPTKGARHGFGVSRDFSDGYRYNTDYVLANYFYQGEWSGSMGKMGLSAGFTDRSFGANGFYASPAYRDQYESIQTSLVALHLEAQRRECLRLVHRASWRRNHDTYLFIRHDPRAYRNLHINHTFGYELNGVLASRAGYTGFGVDVQALRLRSNALGDHWRGVGTFFLEHRVELLDSKLDITPGVQLNYYSDFGGQLFPGIDIGYRLGRLKAFMNWGYTYRVPTYTDLYYRDPVNEGNSGLQPEFAISYEAGLKIVDLPWLHGQGSYFIRRGRRIIDWTKELEDDPWRPSNLIGVDLQGWDMSFTVLPFRGTRSVLEEVGIGYTYIKGNKLGDVGFSRYALEHLRHQGTVGLVFRYGPEISHRVYMRYSDRVHLADYVVVDSRIRWVRRVWGAFVDVNNIFDQVYRETNLVVMPGRWVRLGLSYSVGTPHP
jgi:vitamin B12 transporter